MKFSINAFNESKTIHSGNFESMRECVQDALYNHIALWDADFENEFLTFLDFRAVRLNDAVFSGAFVSHCDFRGADLQGVNFSGAELANCDFRGANLQRAIFNGADVSGCDFRGADVHGAQWLECDGLNDANFLGAEGLTAETCPFLFT